MPDCTVSVVIPSYNNRSGLQRCLAALERQSLARERFELIVVNDGSSDSTWDFLQAFSRRTRLNFSCESQNNAGPGAARNRGVQRARGSWLAFTDDDCMPSQDWLRDYLALLPLPADVAGIGGALRFVPGSYLARFCQAVGQAQNPALDSGDAPYLVTANALYRREEILEVGGFDERFFLAAGEDSDLSYRIIARGGRLLTTERALVWHAAKSLKQLLQTYRRYGAGTRFQAEIGLHPSMDWNLSLIRSLAGERRRALRKKDFVEPEISLFAALEAACHIAFGFGWYSQKLLEQHLHKRATVAAPRRRGGSEQSTRAPVFSIVVLFSSRASLHRTQRQLTTLPGWVRFEVLPVSTIEGDVARARNRAISGARGRYLLTLDTTARLLPSSLEKALFILERVPQVGVVCGPVRFFPELPAADGPDTPPQRPPFPGSHASTPFDPAQLWDSNCIGCGAVVRKELWKELGGYNEQVADEDWDLWLRAACENHRIHRLQEPLYEYPAGERRSQPELRASLSEQLRSPLPDPKDAREGGPSLLLSLADRAYRWLARRQ